MVVDHCMNCDFFDGRADRKFILFDSLLCVTNGGALVNKVEAFRK